MLKRFEVTNFKCFKETLVFDLTARDYKFNTNIVKNGLVNKALIYGKNGSGKSNLGYALFDIITHLTDKEIISFPYNSFYNNLDNENQPVLFKYIFQFEDKEVEYIYEKLAVNYLLSENLLINGETVLAYNYLEKDNNKINSEISNNININLVDNKLSIIKYLYRNLPTDNNSPIFQIINFCENMLWYRSLSDGNSYAGFTNGTSILTDKLYEKQSKLHDFERFLEDNGIHYKLKFDLNMNNNQRDLFVVFKNNNMAPFNYVASTGTKALLLYYIWSIYAFEKVSFLFIDEFDAFLHFESAELLIKLLNKQSNFQTILTTHNTYLMSNKLTRPDCCYILSNVEDEKRIQIRNLYTCTNKEIREAHNLEKMYQNGAFTE